MFFTSGRTDKRIILYLCVSKHCNRNAADAPDSERTVSISRYQRWKSLAREPISIIGDWINTEGTRFRGHDVFGVIARQEERISSATLVNAKFRQNVINRSLSHRVIVSYRQNFTACELEINIFKSNEHITPLPFSHTPIWANIPFPAFSLPPLFFFSTFRSNIIYGFGVSSMDFWITARQMTTVPHGESIEYCGTAIIRPIPTEN